MDHRGASALLTSCSTSVYSYIITNEGCKNKLAVLADSPLRGGGKLGNPVSVVFDFFSRDILMTFSVSDFAGFKNICKSKDS